ncbi:hypothetical protein KBD08_01720 [Candidatus Babeliales bacterium]|nr:hypothetical protein [Candidatus Babeliales bacterium]
MKNNFTKAVLLSVALMTSLSSYALSAGGAWAVGLGTAAAVGLISWGIAKSHKKDKARREDARNTDTKKQSKRDTSKPSYKATTKDTKQQIAEKKRMKKEQRLELKKLEKRGQGSTIEARNRRSEIARLESDITSLKQTLA